MKTKFFIIIKIILCFIYIILLNSCNSCSIATFNSINNYKGSVILKIIHDSIGTIDAYDFYIKDNKGDYSEITIEPEFAKLFNVGDTI